nr:hypothetical protein [Tanacetum cinerariifolium]
KIVKPNHACVLIHDSKDTIEIAEITRKQMIAKMNDTDCVKKKVKTAPHNYSKENYLVTFTPQKQLTPEQILWSDNLLKMKAKALKEKANSGKLITAMTVYPPNTPAKLALESQNKDLTVKVNALQDLNEHFRIDNEKVKQHYKELYDSIKLTHAKTIEKTTSLLDEIQNLKVQLKNNMKCISVPAEKLKVLALGMYAIDVELILPRIRNNREVHLDYLKHLKESVATLREIVEESWVDKPLDRSLLATCHYTKHS